MILSQAKPSALFRFILLDSTPTTPLPRSPKHAPPFDIVCSNQDNLVDHKKANAHLHQAAAHRQGQTYGFSANHVRYDSRASRPSRLAGMLPPRAHTDLDVDRLDQVEARDCRLMLLSVKCQLVVRLRFMMSLTVLILDIVVTDAVSSGNMAPNGLSLDPELASWWLSLDDAIIFPISLTQRSGLRVMSSLGRIVACLTWILIGRSTAGIPRHSVNWLSRLVQRLSGLKMRHC